MKLYKDKILLPFGLGAGLFSFIVYFLTKAPTLSFWDCGEFIACSKILGVSHPPGYPLYTLIGKFFILLPLPFNDAMKVNLVSVLSSAVAVYVAYWLIIRFVIGFDKEISDIWQKLSLAVGGFAGSLVVGFSSTFWDNAIEAECYGLAMMLMLILCYLVLMWANKIGKPGVGKLLIGIGYLAFLSIGIHMTTFLIMPLIVAYMAIRDRKLLYDWKFWAIWFVLLMVVGQLDIFLYGTAAIFIISLVSLFSARGPSYMTKIIFAISFAAVIGYSTHIYLPIRAAQKPEINENNPDNWTRFKSLLERKQYGQESMITRMFDRRGSWTNQFGNHAHMGFWGYFKKQYSENWAAFLFFALGIWGIYEAFRRNTINGLWLLALFLASSVGLILYLNFSDGTQGAILEVRNRDYFFTPGFMFFGLLIGVGLTGLLHDLAGWIKDRPERKYLVTAALIVAILFPIHTLQAHHFEHDRSRNFIPWDYAHNILSSIDKDGIVFTNGDNDTFPLWYIQQVEEFRTDVRVVNLSLLNTPWYIHQLKEQMNVPITFSYDQIEALRPVWDPVKERVWKVQDEMVAHIVKVNKWQVPIFFAVTVSDGNKLGLNDNLIMEGMGYRIVPEQGKNRVDPDKMWQFYMEEFKFRGLDDTTVYKNENDTRLVANYVSGFLQLADTLKRVDELDKAIVVAEKSIDIFPNEWRHRAYLAMLYAQAGQLENIDKIVEGVETGQIVNLLTSAARDALYSQKFSESKDLLKMALEYNPNSKTAFNNLLFIENQVGNIEAIDSLAAMWRIQHEGDASALAELDQLLRSLEAQRQK
ncbi:MAG: DUF2723 domain-containing protein [candidate division Zixibacteria bacterium]|nr:DUF2723 domain-containing protein [candidate division Zixibacteria bacterium]